MKYTEKFTGKAELYAASRPDYTDACMDFLYEEEGFYPGCTVADIGSGTGKFSKRLLERGSRVLGVEPNGDMRRKAEQLLGQWYSFVSVEGSAEHTGLPGASVDFVTAAQAFHWFDTRLFRKECERILRPGGRVVLIWNSRKQEAELHRALEKVFRKYCPDFLGFSGGMRENDTRFSEFFSGTFREVVLDAPLFCTREQFIGRNLSSSYALQPQAPLYGEFLKAMQNVFDRFSQDGRVKVPNAIRIYAGRIA